MNHVAYLKRSSLGALIFGALYFAGCTADLIDTSGDGDALDSISEADVEEIAASREELRTCGGIAAFPCQTGYKCVDDPRDSCDPRRGGADCSGICVAPRLGCNYSDPNKQYIGYSKSECAAMRIDCAPGYEYFSNRCGCGCRVARR